MNQPRNFFNTLNHVPILRVLTAPFIAPLPEIPVRQANVVKPRQPRRHLAAALGLILSIICVLPVAAQNVVGVTVSKSTVTVTEASGSSNTNTYTVKLNTRPSGNVTIAITGGDTSIATVSPTSPASPSPRPVAAPPPPRPVAPTPSA